MAIVQLSQGLLRLAREKNESSKVRMQLAKFNILALIDELNNDNVKKAFWINIYNAYYLLLSQKYALVKFDSALFKRKEIEIAGCQFSLDDIEHGILRKMQYKYAFGYLKFPFYSKIVKELQVERLDYRIHFALNCGAKSCPPIRFYNVRTIDQELDLAMHSFVESTTIVGSSIGVSKLFLWYKGDFNGQKGILDIINSIISLNENQLKMKIRYLSYNKELL